MWSQASQPLASHELTTYMDIYIHTETHILHILSQTLNYIFKLNLYIYEILIFSSSLSL